jgi:DNA-binding NtrC family response regulator
VASEPFGHEKGAFTGALSSQEGKFEAAAGGTIFPDEVGTMDLSTQISLTSRARDLLVPTRVGADKERDADVRIIAATNRDLLDLVEANQFREDLYYRLNVFTIAIPPLRERAEDVVPIAERFLRFFAKRYGTPARCLSDKALERLLGHQWPGNVRELRNVMEQTAVFAQREVVHAEEIQFISTRVPTHQRGPRPEARVERPPVPGRSSRGLPPLSDMPDPAPELVRRRVRQASCAVGRGANAHPPISSASPMPSPTLASAPEAVAARPAAQSAANADDHPLVLRIPVGTPLAEAERMLIIKTLEVSDGNKQRAARILGISRRGLYTKLAAYGEHVPADESADNGVSGSDNGARHDEHAVDETPTPNA